MSASLSATDDVWKTAVQATFRWHPVQDAEIERYALLLTRLRRELEDLALNPGWHEALRWLRAGLFAVAGTPLPWDNPAMGLPDLAGNLRRSLPILRASAPQFSNALVALVNALEEMAQSPHDPLGDSVRALLPDQSAGEICILLRWPRRIDATASQFASSGLVRVASASQLRDVRLFEQIIAIGPSTWFPSLLSAPRTRRVDITHLNVTKDVPMIAALFSRSRSRGRVLHSRPDTQAQGGTLSGYPLEDVDEELFRPDIEWAAIDRAGRGGSEGAPDYFDNVQARLALLAGGYGCYLETEQGSRNTILDLRAVREERVRQVDWRDVEVGTVLILRTEGGDDVSHLANEAMGLRSSALRQKQQDWKVELRKQVILRGYAQVTQMLRNLGSPLASPQNVQNWSSMSTIKTRDFADFEAIMRLIGWADRATETWEDMRVIHKAHLQAGIDRVARLRERIEHADLIALDSAGRVDFEVPTLGAGTLTAFRVEEVSSDAFTVSRNRVDHPFQVEEALWHG